VRQAQPLPRLGLVLLAGLSFAWGINWPFMKIVLAEIPLWTFRSWSCLIAGLLLLAIGHVTGGRVKPTRAEWTPILVGALLNVTIWHVFVALGVMEMASGHAAVLAFTMPLWSAIISVVFLGEKMTGRVALALALGIGGIFVLLSRNFTAVGESPLGAAYMLTASVGWAIGTLYQKRQRFTVGTLALAGWQLALGTVPMFIILPFADGIHFPQASAAAWGAAAYTTVVALVFAYFAWFKIVSLFPASIAGIGTLLTPVIGMVSGAVVLGEPFGWREILAMTLIGSALVLVLIIPALRPRAAAVSAE
jgi:drug/metabolite transporter (DMT)-like permease